MTRHSPLAFFLLAAVVFFAVSDAAKGQEWTRFRGPNGTGIGAAPNLPETFSEKDFNWNVELSGPGHSSPVIWGDRVFITGNPKGGTKRVISCLSSKDGKALWQKEYDTAGHHLHSDNNYAASSPAVDAERVYFHWASPEKSGVAALDQASGKELWKVDLGPFVSQHGPGASPIVFEDKVILNFDQDQPKSFLVALDSKTGKERWRWEHEGTKHTASTPCIFTPKTGAPQVITEGFSIGVCATDANTGKLAWQLPSVMTKRCVSSPFIATSGVIIAQCGEGRAESFVEEVRPAPDGKSAEKIFEIVRVGGYVPTPIAYKDRLYLWKENGLITCLNLTDNKQLWSERAEGPYYGSPVCVNGRLYNMTTRGDLVILATGDQFKVIARIPLGEGSQATPAVSGGRMYLRTASHLISVGK